MLHLPKVNEVGAISLLSHIKLAWQHAGQWPIGTKWHMLHLPANGGQPPVITMLPLHHTEPQCATQRMTEGKRGRAVTCTSHSECQ